MATLSTVVVKIVFSSGLTGGAQKKKELSKWSILADDIYLAPATVIMPLYLNG